MTFFEYQELKDLATEHIVPLANREDGCFCTVTEIVWGDGPKCGKETGFTARAVLGDVYYRCLDVRFWDDYAEKKAALSQMVEDAEAKRPKAHKVYNCVNPYNGNEQRLPDCQTSGDGINPYRW